MNRHNVIQFTATIAVEKTTRWPHFAGSHLRGAFGRALRRAVCVTGKPTCQDCPLRTACAYGVIFNPAAPTLPLHPSFQNGIPLYVMRPPAMGAANMQHGQVLQFQLLLFPGAHSHLGVIEHILKTAVNIELNTPGTFKLLNLHTDEIQVLNLDSHSTALLNNSDCDPETSKTQVTVQWLTPLRIQHNGAPIFNASDFNSSLLMRALLRRQLQWAEISRQQPVNPEPYYAAAQLCHLDVRNTTWHDMARRSDAQNKKVPLGGLLGSAELIGPHHAVQMFMPLLQIAQVIGLGKETVMGLGQLTHTHVLSTQ